MSEKREWLIPNQNPFTGDLGDEWRFGNRELLRPSNVGQIWIPYDEEHPFPSPPTGDENV